MGAIRMSLTVISATQILDVAGIVDSGGAPIGSLLYTVGSATVSQSQIAYSALDIQGLAQVSSGGSVTASLVDQGGSLYVFAGGSALATSVAGGGSISDAGLVSGGTISANGFELIT